MTTVRLAWRLLRGGGRQGAVRLLLLTLGVVIAVTAVLSALALTSALGDRERRAQQREPTSASQSAQGLLSVRIRQEVYHDQAWRRLLVGNVGPGAARPPGVRELPQPGQSVVSPALYSARADPAVGLRLGKIVGVIGEEGLLGPNDLVSYTGVQGSSPGSVRSWGTTSKIPSEAPGRRLVQLELLLLIGLPLAMFVQVASRLSAATRSHRVRCLALVGVPTEMIGRTAGLEGAVVGATGAALGIGLFATINGSLATSGILGFTWFSSATSPGLAWAAAITVTVTLSSAWLSARTAVSGGPSSPTSPSPARKVRQVWRRLPLLAGLLLLLFVVPLLPSRATDERAGLTVLGVILSSLGLVLVVRPIALALGGSILARTQSVAARLAVRRLQYEPDGGRTVVVAVISLILLAGIAQAVLHALQEASGFSRDRVVVEVSGAHLTASQRVRVAGIGAREWVRGEFAQTGGGATGPPFIEVYRMPCSALAAAVGPVEGCMDGRQYTLQDADRRLRRPLPVGLTLTAGLGRPVAVPAEELLIPNLAGSRIGLASVLEATADPNYPWSETSFFRLGAATSDVERVEAALLPIEPTMDIRIRPRDITRLTESRLHRGGVRMGLVVGLGLGLLSLVTAAVDRVFERRRAVAALVVVGVPLMTLRRAQALLLLIPLVAGAVPAVLVSALSAYRYLRLGGTTEGYHATPLAWSAAMAVAASIVALATGLVVAGSKPTGPELRRE